MPFYHEIKTILSTYFASFPEDDIFEGISNLHVQGYKFGGKFDKFGGKFDKLGGKSFLNPAYERQSSGPIQ